MMLADPVADTTDPMRIGPAAWANSAKAASASRASQRCVAKFMVSVSSV